MSTDTTNCPHCTLPISKKATRCPHCQGIIIKGKNLLTGLILNVLTFYIIYQGVTWYIDRESSAVINKINLETESEIRRIQRDSVLKNY